MKELFLRLFLKRFFEKELHYLEEYYMITKLKILDILLGLGCYDPVLLSLTSGQEKVFQIQVLAHDFIFQCFDIRSISKASFLRSYNLLKHWKRMKKLLGLKHPFN